MRIRFKTALLLAALGITATANAAVNLHAEAGEKFTNLSASFGASDPDLTFNGYWGHSDDDSAQAPSGDFITVLRLQLFAGLALQWR